jgi:membrane-bound lytic murein transglycosylase D
VQSGDSLWTIARKFDVTEKELREWNRLGQKDTLRLGQVLQVVSKGGKAVASGQTKADSARRIVYQVQPGDSLWAISRKFDVPARHIMDWNNLGEQHVLRPGDRLTIHVRQQG